jgi:6-phosphogluconolactonase
MENVTVCDDNAKLANAVAKATIIILRRAIENHGNAVWVLSGGSTPLHAYQKIAEQYAKTIDWKKVTIAIGDERIGPVNGPHSNWHAIEQMLNSLPTKKLIPASNLSADEAAEDYEKKLGKLPKQENALPRIDLLWLGVGPDGHTLSLFPGNLALVPSSSLVVPVHNSPKPPADRFSLSFRALMGVESALVIASGKDKKEAIQGAMFYNGSPLSIAVSILQTHEAKIFWLLDKACSPTD